MRGISKETLERKLATSKQASKSIRLLLESLINECVELNRWLPIEDAPKDRRLNLYWKGYGWFTGKWRMGQYFCDAGLMVPVNIKPTHYQELPDDPEPGDKNG